MPDVKHYQIPEGQKNAGMWTFSVDGQPSRYYCPNEHAVKRIIARLEKGETHSLEAALVQSIADANLVKSLLALGLDNPATGQPFTRAELEQIVREKLQRVRVAKAKDVLPQAMTAEGEQPKPVKGWCYALDGQTCPTVYRHEAQAKSAGAFAAFMSRGKLAGKGE